MANRCIAPSMRGVFLNSVTGGRARFALLPILAGAAMALAGNAFTPTQAFAADVVCAPVPSSTVLTGDTTCTGTGDQILFLSQTAPATVTVNGVTITGATAPSNAVEVTNGTQNLTIAVTGGGSITATAAGGSAIVANGSSGNVTVSVGATPLAGTGLVANGISIVTSTGDISVTAAGTVIDGVALDGANFGTGISAFSNGGGISVTTTGAGSIGNFAGTTLDTGIFALTDLPPSEWSKS